MNKKGYNEARKNHYNVKVVKEASLTEYMRKVEAEAKAEEKRIATKAELFGVRKAELEYSLSYNEKYIRKHSGSVADGWSETCSSYFEAMEAEKEALQALEAQAEDLKKLESVTARFETCAEWLACNVEDIEKPIECELWHFCRNQRTREAIDCMTFSKSGARQDTQRYPDYKQECLMYLYEYAINHPEDNFQKALYLSVKDGLYSEWSKWHKLKKVKASDGTKKTVERVIDSLDKPLDSEDSESATLKDSLPNTLAKPLDFNLVQAEAEARILSYTRGKEAEDLKSVADGYTLKEVSFYNGEKYDTTKKRFERMKKRVAEDLHKEAEENIIALEVASKLKKTIWSKAITPEEPEAYHKTECKPCKPCEYNIASAEAFKRMINKPLVYNRVVSGSGSKAIMKVNNDSKLSSGYHIVKTASASLETVKAQAPEAKAKYSEYDNDGLKARIHKAEVKKAEYELWELKNASYCKKLYANI